MPPSNTHTEQPAPRRLFFSFIITLLAACTYFMSDMISPALPQICHDLAVSSHAVKQTIGLYLLGMILPQLLLGPLSDAFGRKKIIIGGLLVALLGSLLAGSVHTLIALNIARVLQGIGGGAISLNARAMGRDLYSGKQLIQFSATIGTVIGLAPALAPLLGGYLMHAFHWPAIFTFMIGWLAIMLTIALTLLPETNHHRHATTFSMQSTYTHYHRLLHSSNFVTHTLYAAMSFAIIMVYYTLSPHLLQIDYHLSVLQYSWSCAGIILMMIGSRLCNIGLLRYIAIPNLITLGINITLCASGFLALATAFHMVSVTLLLVSTSGIMVGLGLIIGNTMAQAFSGARDIAGAAGALYGVILACTAGLCSTIAAHLPANTVGSFSYFSLVLTAITAAINMGARRYASAHNS